MLDRKLAEESGIDTRPFYYAILFICGITVSVCLKLIGGLFIFDLMVNPVSSGAIVIMSVAVFLASVLASPLRRRG